MCESFSCSIHICLFLPSLSSCVKERTRVASSVYIWLLPPRRCRCRLRRLHRLRVFASCERDNRSDPFDGGLKIKAINVKLLAKLGNDINCRNLVRCAGGVCLTFFFETFKKSLYNSERRYLE